MLFITNNSIKHQLFIYTWLNDQTVLFQTIQFSISHLIALILNVHQYYLTHRGYPIGCYHCEPQRTWEQWQWRGTPNSPKPQHCCCLIIILFRVISTRTFAVGGVLPFCRHAICIFFSPSWLGMDIVWLLIFPMYISICCWLFFHKFECMEFHSK